MSQELLKLRGDLYAFLGSAYLEHPSRSLIDALSSGKVLIPSCEEIGTISQDLAEGFSLLKSYIDGISDKEQTFKSLRDEFTTLFIGPMSPRLFPYESFYREGRLFGNSLLKVKEFIRRIGYEKASSFPEPEDHISFEIAVVQHLCSRQLLLKDERDIKEILDLQRSFLEEHLLKWVPSFCEDLYKVAGSEFYKGLAKITGGFIEIDLDLIDAMLMEIGGV